MFFMSVCYTYSVSDELHDNIVRLHVIANSNSDFDQEIKYRVRDKFISDSEKIEENGFDLEYMKHEAESVLIESGADYGAVCQFGDFYFPMKRYENIALPCGSYRAVRIILGNGEGRNWWCVLSPPMCFTSENVAAADGTALSKVLSSDTIDVISDKNGISYRFWIVEKIKELTK